MNNDMKKTTKTVFDMQPEESFVVKCRFFHRMNPGWSDGSADNLTGAAGQVI